MSLLTPESASEFNSARSKAFVAEWLHLLTGRPNDLLSFEEVKQNLRLQDSAYKGLQEIELDKIVGSTGRYRDFDRSFLPKNNQTQERWRRVDAVAHEQGVPPIDVYQVGDVYFVRDGNHRVSVARAHNAKTIEAYVIEYKTPVPITKDDDLEDIVDRLDDLLIDIEQEEFFEDTRLDKIRPEQNVTFTEPGRYRLVKEHIGFHKFLLETECNCEVPYSEAVVSWYDNVYLPLVEVIRQQDVLVDFPDRTEADIYAWIMLHRAQLEKEVDALGYVPDEEMLEAVKRERATNSFARLMGYFRYQLDLRSLPLKVGRTKFLEETQLDSIRPDHGIHFTEPGCYQLAQKHINDHKYFKELETGYVISYPEAVASWYDNVYMPVIELIRQRGVLENFPKNTEGDLYIWLVSRRQALEEENHALGAVPTEKVIWDLELEISSMPVLRQFLSTKHKLDLQSVLDEQ